MPKDKTTYRFACEVCGDVYESSDSDDAYQAALACEHQGIEVEPLPAGTPVIRIGWEGSRTFDNQRLVITLDEVYGHQVGSGRYQHGAGHQIEYSLVDDKPYKDGTHQGAKAERRYYHRPRDFQPHEPGQVNRMWDADRDTRTDGERLNRRAFHAGHYSSEEDSLQRAAELAETLAGRPLRRDWLIGLWATDRLGHKGVRVLPPRDLLDPAFRDALDALAEPITVEELAHGNKQRTHGFRWVYDQIQRGTTRTDHQENMDPRLPLVAPAALAIALEKFDGAEARARAWLLTHADELPEILHRRSQEWWDGKRVLMPAHLIKPAAGTGSGDGMRAAQKKALLAVGGVEMRPRWHIGTYNDPGWQEDTRIEVVSEPSSRYGQKHARYRPANALAGLFGHHPDMRSIIVKKDTNRPPVPVICVASGKGGVGKTTVASSLAFALTRLGKIATVVDLDTQAPSLAPLLDLPPMQAREGRLIPHQIEGVGFWSPGQLFKEDQAISMGDETLEALLGFLAGALDLDGNSVLIVDLPPGTSDVQYVVNRMWRPLGTLLVTTGSKVAHADLRRQFEIAANPLGIVENLTRIQAPNSGEEVRLYDGADTTALAQELGVEALGSLPHEGDPQTLASTDEMQFVAGFVAQALDTPPEEPEEEHTMTNLEELDEELA